MQTKLPLKKKIALELHKIYISNASKLHKLNYLFWECTLRCNLKCQHCGSDCKVDLKGKDMPIKDFIKVIDEISPQLEPNNTIIVMTGGEPLMRKDLEECGKELYKRGFPWGTVTNGYLLNKNRLTSLLNAGLRSITISLDGLEESHNWLRGNKESFRRALRAIELLPSIENLKYDVVTCVTKKNYEELPEIKERLISLGVKDWRIFTIFPIGRAKENEELQLSSKSFKRLFDFIKETRKEGDIKLSYGCEGFLGNYEGEVRDNLYTCQAGVSVASVLADGSISACPNINHAYIQGNIYTDKFMDVWDDKFQDYRDRKWAKTGICKECKYFKFCRGNGMHLRDPETGEVMFCHLKRIEEGCETS